MKFVIFGLTISSSWGNGHATLWRGLCRALHRRGHRVVFYERDTPYYAAHRDLWELPEGRLRLYGEWGQVVDAAEHDLRDADVAMVTSYCPDGIAASDLVLSSTARLRAFYDLDTPVTLGHLRSGGRVFYLPSDGLGDFDLVLSYTGGAAFEELSDRLGARRVAPLYGSVDPEVHCPMAPRPHYVADLSYLGTYAEDRQAVLLRLFIEPARSRPQQRFLIGGAQYPQAFPWTENIYFVQHLPPSEHPAFFSSCRWTLNVTRQAMADMGWCPSGRLFEAAACGAPLLSDAWEGLDAFFEPGSEVLIARTPEDTLAALDIPHAERQQIGRRARERTLDEYTCDRRARDLESALEEATGVSAADDLWDANGVGDAS